MGVSSGGPEPRIMRIIRPKGKRKLLGARRRLGNSSQFITEGRAQKMQITHSRSKGGSKSQSEKLFPRKKIAHQ